MNEQKQSAVAGPVEPTVRPGLPVIGCVWGGMVWLVSLRSPVKMDLGARLYTEAELDAAVSAERERCAKLCETVPSFTKTQCDYFAAAVRGKGPNAAGKAPAAPADGRP